LASTLPSNSDYELAGPKGLDPQIVGTLHDAFKQGIQEPAFINLLATLEQEPIYRSPQTYQAYIRYQIEVQRRIVLELGLKVTWRAKKAMPARLARRANQ
jgi:tripartite-type tricarboxylate transporter receptor subunit TctC